MAPPPAPPQPQRSWWPPSRWFSRSRGGPATVVPAQPVRRDTDLEAPEADQRVQLANNPRPDEGRSSSGSNSSFMSCNSGSKNGSVGPHDQGLMDPALQGQGNPRDESGICEKKYMRR